MTKCCRECPFETSANHGCKSELIAHTLYLYKLQNEEHKYFMDSVGVLCNICIKRGHKIKKLSEALKDVEEKLKEWVENPKNFNSNERTFILQGIENIFKELQ